MSDAVLCDGAQAKSRQGALLVVCGNDHQADSRRSLANQASNRLARRVGGRHGGERVARTRSIGQWRKPRSYGGPGGVQVAPRFQLGSGAKRYAKRAGGGGRRFRDDAEEE